MTRRSQQKGVYGHNLLFYKVYFTTYAPNPEYVIGLWFVCCFAHTSFPQESNHEQEQEHQQEQEQEQEQEQKQEQAQSYKI
jgi:hypothetical protein